METASAEIGAGALAPVVASVDDPLPCKGGPPNLSVRGLVLDLDARRRTLPASLVKAGIEERAAAGLYRSPLPLQ